MPTDDDLVRLANQVLLRGDPSVWPLAEGVLALSQENELLRQAIELQTCQSGCEERAEAAEAERDALQEENAAHQSIRDTQCQMAGEHILAIEVWRKRAEAAELRIAKTAERHLRAEMLEATIEALRAREKVLRGVVRGMLLSADASWEESNQGHDWSQACVDARAALAPDSQKEANEA